MTANKSTTVKNISVYSKHIRTREDNEKGVVTYRGLCGASGTNRLAFAKSAVKANCPDCLKKMGVEKWD